MCRTRPSYSGRALKCHRGCRRTHKCKIRGTNQADQHAISATWWTPEPPGGFTWLFADPAAPMVLKVHRAPFSTPWPLHRWLEVWNNSTVSKVTNRKALAGAFLMLAVFGSSAEMPRFCSKDLCIEEVRIWREFVPGGFSYHASAMLRALDKELRDPSIRFAGNFGDWRCLRRDRRSGDHYLRA